MDSCVHGLLLLVRFLNVFAFIIFHFLALPEFFDETEKRYRGGTSGNGISLYSVEETWEY